MSYNVIVAVLDALVHCARSTCQRRSLPVEAFREGGTAFLLHLPRHRSAAGSTKSRPKIGRSGEHFFAGPYEPGRDASRTWSAGGQGLALLPIHRRAGTNGDD